MNLRSKKWLKFGTYNPKTSHIKKYLQILLQRFNQYFRNMTTLLP